VEHHKADVWQVAGRGTAGDDTARFLHELRQLRDGAGLGQAELAAKAHYPFDTIKAAEAGPSLPDLPVLSAYVRGCGGTAEEWEERWRRLTRTPSLPVAASRDAGNSAAASAGARIGAATQVVDAPDPSVIIAALGRVAEGMAVGDTDMDAAALTVPSRPSYPAADSPVGSAGDVSPADPSLADVPLRDVPLGDVALGDVSLHDALPPEVSLGDVSWAGAFTAGPADNPVADSADFSAFTPFAPVAPADDSLVTPADGAFVTPAAGSTADSPFAPAEPAADDTPKGWDPIRVSAAWPAIGNEDPRRTDATSPGAARPGTDGPAGGLTRPAIRQSAWARGVDASGESTGVARPGSRARTLMVAVVLICVLAVVLAIFA